MPLFTYVAKNNQGEIKKGEMESKDRASLAEALRTQGFFVTAISEKEESFKNKSFSKFGVFSRISLKDKMMFARHLSVMLGSGLSLPRALEIIANQTKSRKFKKVLANLSSDVKTGSTLGDSLAKQGVFDDLSVNMIRVGEIGGNIEEVLKLLADQLEKEHSLLSKVRGAMYYPTVIFIVMIVIGIAMMTFVVPKLTAIFDDMQSEIPFTTQIIISVSGFMSNHKLLVLFLILFFSFSIFVFLRTRIGKRILGFLSLKIPVVKNVVVKVNNARFARIYSSLTKSGVPVVESLKIISKTLTNHYYKKAFLDVKDGVQKGGTLHDGLSRHPRLFPVLVVQMVEVGEETGKTADVLIDLARFYEDEINQVTKNISSIIEPVLMVIIGSAVGFFAISMLTPMYSVMEKM